MVAFPTLSALRPGIAVDRRVAALLPIGVAIIAAAAAAGTMALLPIGLLERLVWTSGVATLVPMAQPPLGATARVLLAVGAGLAAGAVAWSALFLLVGPGGLFGPAVRSASAPNIPPVGRPARVRRGDAHPDAPPPRPMTAADLGTPLMEVAPPRVQPLPADLDQPLAAFDPAALPATPLKPVRALAPLATTRFAADERIETFALDVPPVAEEAPPPPHRKEPGSPPTIDSLLRRLEESAGRRLAVR